MLTLLDVTSLILKVIVLSTLCKLLDHYIEGTIGCEPAQNEVCPEDFVLVRILFLFSFLGC